MEIHTDAVSACVVKLKKGTITLLQKAFYS